MLLPALLVIAHQTGSSVGLDVPVTYSEPARSVGTALSEIMKAKQVQSAGVRLAANPEASKEVVLIDVAALPLKALMDKIAFVTSCRWENVGSSYTLMPAVSVRNREEQDDSARRTQLAKTAIAEKLAKAEKSAASKETGSQPDAAPEGFGLLQGGNDVEIAQILQQVDPAQLAAIQAGARTVWATNGSTSVQIPLSGDNSALVANWVAEHNKRTKGSSPDQMPIAMPKPILDSLKRSMSPVSEPVAKTILVAERMALFGITRLRLVGFSSSGKILLTAESTLDSDFLAHLARAGAGVTPIKEGASPIEFSADTKAVTELFKNVAMPGGGNRLPPGVEAKLLHPDQVDPLTFGPTEVFRAVAAARHRQLVADLPDQTMGSGSFVGGGSQLPKTVEDAEATINSKETVTAVDDGQFLYVRPAWPSEARSHRLDRVALARLLHISQIKLLPSLDDIADYAVANDDPMSSAISAIYISYFSPSLFAGSLMGIGQGGWPALRAYGSLDPSQRELLKSGGSVGFGSLTQPEQSAVTAYLFGSSSSIQAEGDSSADDFLSKTMQSFFSMGSDYRNEPTEVMPNGLPQAGSISATSASEPIVLASEGEGVLSHWPLGPQEVAMFRLFQKSVPGATTQLKLPKKGILGVRLRLTLLFHVAPKLVVSATLMDPVVDPKSAANDISTLPSDFQARVDSETKSLEEGSLGMLLKMGMGGKVPSAP